MKNVSLQQIADELSVSRITVSKVINGKSGVSEKTKKLILRKLSEHGYKKTKDSIVEDNDDIEEETREEKNIAVVATEPGFSDFWLKIINGISSEVSKRHYNLIYHFISKEDIESYEVPPNLQSKNVDGIVAVNLYDDKAITGLIKTGLPIVLLDTTPTIYESIQDIDLILLEGYHTIYNITKSLIDQGCKTLGFIGDITYCQTILDRYQGFEKACIDNGIVIDEKHCFTKSSGGHFYYPNELQDFLDQIDELPSAFVCANDAIAHTLIKYLAKKCIHVPRDIAVSGYDNINVSMLEDSEITTASVDTTMLGRRIARQILLKINKGYTFYETVYVKPTILYRRSTKLK